MRNKHETDQGRDRQDWRRFNWEIHPGTVRRPGAHWDNVPWWLKPLTLEEKKAVEDFMSQPDGDNDPQAQGMAAD